MADDSTVSPDSASDAGSSSGGALRYLLYGIGGFVALVLVAAIALPQLFPPERLKKLAIPPVEEAVQRDVTVEDIRLSVLPFPSVRVSDFAIANDSAFTSAHAFDPEPAISGRTLNVDVALWPLFTGTIEPTSIELVDPVVRYQVAEDGTTNFDTFATSETAEADTTSGDGLPVEVSNFVLSGARVLYDDRSSGQWAELGFAAQLEARSGEAPGSIDSRGAVEMSTLKFLSAPDADTTALQNATLEYDLLAALEDGSLELRRVELLTPPIGIETSGTVSALNEARPVVDLNVNTTEADLAQLAAIVPGGVGEGIAPGGTASFNMTARGPLPDSTGTTDGFALNGTGSVSGVGVDVDGTTMLENLGASIALSLDSLTVSDIDGQLLGKPLSGQITVADLLSESPRLDGRLAGAADLAQLSSLAAEDGGAPVDVAGSVDYDIRFAGPATNTDAIRVQGPIRLASVRVPNESLREPLEIAAATINLTGRGVSAEPFRVTSGSADMEVGFTVRDLLPVSQGLAEENPAMRVAFTFRSDEIDLVELFPEADADEPLYSDLFTAQLAGTRVNGRPAEEVAAEMYGDVELPAFRVEGDVEIGALLNDPQRFDNLAFDVQLRNRRMEIPNLSAQTYGGTLAGSIVLDQSAAAASAYVRPVREESVLMASSGTVLAPARMETLPIPATPTALSYDFELQDAQASAFLRDWTRLGEAISGTINLSVAGDSPLTEGLLPVAQALTAGGRSLVADGGFDADFGLVGKLVNRLGVKRPSLSDFQRFGGPFTIEDGELRVGEWNLGNAELKSTITGALGLGGTVDLQMQSEMPLSMIRGSKLNSGGASTVLNRLGGKDGTVPVGIQIGGTMQNPSYNIDTSAMQEALKELLPRGIRRLID